MSFSIGGFNPNSIPQEIRSQGREAVKEYAEENGIQLPPPPQGAQHGQQAQNPFGNSEQSEQSSMKSQFEATLVALGIPQDTVSQGKEAVKEYAEENGIQLPPPPEKGMNLELTA